MSLNYIPKYSFNKLFFAICFLSFFLSFSSNSLFSQNSKGGIPLSISEKIEAPDAFIAPQPDWVRIRTEDKGPIGSFRFAVPIPVNLTLHNAGKWRDLTNGDRIWQCRIKSTDALGLALSLDNFELPEGSKLYILSPNGSSVLGAYTSENNAESRKFFLGFVYGSEAIVEYIEPKNVAKKADFAIKTIYHAYNNREMSALGFGSSINCEVNINCPTAANWQVQKQGVVRIRIVAAEGVGWCSGSLVNNTARDGKPYILSAYHCSDGYTPDYTQWTFYFNYESPTCQNPTTEPTSRSIQGCVLRSGARETDFLLLEMNQRVTADANVQYLGWNRDSAALPTSTVLIHHPQGDTKKYARDSHPSDINTSTIAWSSQNISPYHSHLKTVFDEGTVEPGSSGSPLFDQTGRIVGQLHGGNMVDSCHVSYMFSGWFAKSWDGNGTPTSRLKDWLDPLSTGANNLDTMANPNTVFVSGSIKTWWNDPMINQKIYIGNDSTTTNASGYFTFNSIPINTPLTVTLSRPTNVGNGIDAVDILLIRRYLLGISTLKPEQLWAADVDQSGDVDATDILLIRRYLLGISSTLPVGEYSWRFFPELTIKNTNSPYNAFSINFSASTSSFNLIAVKTGDVDGSADSSQ